LMCREDTSCVYSLLAVDHIFKWLEAIAMPNNDSKVEIEFLIKNIFTRFGTPWDRESLLKKYGFFHKIATPYQPQTNGHVEL